MARFMMLLSIAVLQIFSTGTAHGDDASAVLAEYEAARTACDAELQKWNSDVLESLEKQILVARNRRDASQVAFAESEKARFENEEMIPVATSRGMRKRLLKIVQPMQKISEETIKALTAAGADEKATAVQADLDALLAPIQKATIRDQLVGQWNLVAGTYRSTYNFHAGGLVEDLRNRGTSTWTIDLEKQQIVTLGNDGGGWKDYLFLPLNPKRTEGRNMRGDSLIYSKVK